MGRGKKEKGKEINTFDFALLRGSPKFGRESLIGKELNFLDTGPLAFDFTSEFILHSLPPNNNIVE